MEFAVTDLGTRRKEIAVTVPSAAIQTEFGAAYNEVGKQVDIPGFRKGKIPRKVLEKRYGDYVTNDVCDRLVSNALQQAAEKEDLPIIGTPEFDIKREELSANADFAFKVKVDLKPVVTVPEYEGIEVERNKVSVNDADVQSYLENLQQRYGKEEDVTEGALAEKDSLMADCSLTVEGEEIDNREDVYVAPSAGWIFGTKSENLQELLAGKSIGDTIESEVEIPDTYKEEAHRGKKGQLKATIKKIRRIELPEINDAFAEQLGLDDLDELRDEIKENIEREQTNAAEEAARTQLTDKLVEKSSLEASENMLKKYKEYVVQRSLQQLQMYGVSEDMLKERKEEMEKTAGETAQKEVALDALLTEIAEKERIYATEKEVQEALAQAASQQQMELDKFKEELQNRGMMTSFRDDIRKRKVTDLLMKKAKVTEVDPPAESTEASQS